VKVKSIYVSGCGVVKGKAKWEVKLQIRMNQNPILTPNLITKHSSSSGLHGQTALTQNPFAYCSVSVNTLSPTSE